MSKWMRAMMLGMEILHDIELILAGQATSFTFMWNGTSFTVSVTPPKAPPTA